MSPMLIGQIFGILTTVSAVISTQMPKRWQMMLGTMVVNIFSTLNVLFVGAGLTVCMANIVASIHAPINAYRAKKGLNTPFAEKLVFCVLYFVAWGVGFYLSVKAGTASWLDLLPLIATAFFVAKMLLPRERDIRLCLLGNSLVYIVYHSIFKNIGVLAHIFSLVSTVIALYRYREKKERNLRTIKASKNPSQNVTIR